MSENYHYGTGRRKSSVARVYMKPGSGKIEINGRDIDVYLGNHEVAKMVIRQPLELLELSGKFDFKVNVDATNPAVQLSATATLISLLTHKACKLSNIDIIKKQ